MMSEQPTRCPVFVGGYHPAGEVCECFHGGSPVIGFPTPRASIENERAPSAD